MNRKLLITLAAVVLNVFSTPSVDAASGLYIGGGIGQSTLKKDFPSGEFDSSDAAYKVFAGYRFNLLPIFDIAAEGGYTDFGKPSQDVGPNRVQYKLHGFDAAGLLIFPLGPVDFYGKVGVLSWSLDASGALTTSSATSGTDPFYGLGIGFYVWKIGFRAEFEQYKIKDIDRVQMYTLNALFQF